jgi:hypothetical protein
MFSKQDIDQYTAKGISPEVIEHQLEKFRTGFPFTKIDRTATLGDGMDSFSENELTSMTVAYDLLSKGLSITRFVPASGAATRMFKSLFSILEKMRGLPTPEQLTIVTGDTEIRAFFKEIESYPFFEDLQLKGTESPQEMLRMILDDSGLSYGTLPKGLLKFHSYASGSRTAFEEHLREAAGYCAQGGRVRMHFTISPEHKASFDALQDELLPGLENELNLKFDLTYSNQKEETDTLAVDNDNQPFRDDTGKLVFRPGGHGALLENLNEISGDIVFISNIDNVAPDRIKASRVQCKKFIGGVLLKAREEIYEYMSRLSADENPSEEFFNTLFAWMSREMSIDVPKDIYRYESADKRAWAMSILDRPLRVCGMVKNEGEPGGGPFFVKDDKGHITLQVVEPSQIDIDNPEQKELLLSSTHFNPVDLACSIRNHQGEKYNLMKYRNPDTGFITAKSTLGKELKAQELPGLWNGSMAHWTSIFVEVPVSTFTPVKTVFDLTRAEHQS